MDTQTLEVTDSVVNNHKTGLEIVDMWGKTPWFAVWCDGTNIGCIVGETRAAEHLTGYARNHGVNLLEARRLYLESLQDDEQTKRDLERHVAKSFAPPRPPAPRPAERPRNEDLKRIDPYSKNNALRRVYAVMHRTGLPEQPKAKRLNAVNEYFGLSLESFSDATPEQLNMIADAIEGQVFVGDWELAHELAEVA